MAGKLKIGLAIGAALTGANLLADVTIADRIAEFGEPVRLRLAPAFQQAGIAFPPARLALIGFKQERRLEVYAAEETGPFRFIRAYPIKAASGVAGPKLREGDQQVPEGIYRIESLNPNSRFHLALRISYPNESDRAQAARDGRTELGGDIMIHGNAVSSGCLAMGDEAAEDLFVLAELTGLPHITVLLSPVDFRKSELPAEHRRADWVRKLHERIRGELTKYPAAP